VQEVIGFGSVTKSLYKRTVQKFIEKYILKGTRQSKATFVVSEPIKAYLASHHVSNLYLTPHCVNLKTFSEPLLMDFHKKLARKREEGKFIVCYVGWVSKERGLDLMLEAINEAVKQNPEILFAIAGSYDASTRLINEYAQKNNISENILCFGKIEYEYIPGLIALSNVCLSLLEDNPVYRMSPPQKVIEYFAAGKPVIANNIQTHNLLITDSYDGFITPYDSEAISQKILFLQSNKTIYQQMCSNALHTAAKYDTGRVYEKLKEMITNTLNNGK
jgi:glycosyltransferase involved in cell wall biosynthesis